MKQFAEFDYTRELGVAWDTIYQARSGWRCEPMYQTNRFLVRASVTYPFARVPLLRDDSRLAVSFAYYQRAPQHEYLYHYRCRAYIEPIYGYIVRGLNTIVPVSMPHFWDRGFPSPLPYFRGRTCGRWQIERVQSAISLREFGDTNYYHFYNDVLGKLALLAQEGLDSDIPVVISAALARQPFFQALLRTTALAQRRWIVQDNVFVEADEIFFCKPLPHIRRNFDYALELIGAPKADNATACRILLTRKPKRGRWIENMPEVEQVCEAFGFCCVDADDLTLAEQIECFRGARFVIGIHGAGLTNCIYRQGAPMGLLELFPPDNLPPHYFWLAQTYGYSYNALVGDPGSQPGAFRVNLDTLRTKIQVMLGSSEHAL